MITRDRLMMKVVEIPVLHTPQLKPPVPPAGEAYTDLITGVEGHPNHPKLLPVPVEEVIEVELHLMYPPALLPRFPRMFLQGPEAKLATRTGMVVLDLPMDWITEETTRIVIIAITTTTVVVGPESGEHHPEETIMGEAQSGDRV